MMREAQDWQPEQLASRLGLTVDELKMAENGQFVERAVDGRLIDFPAALLILAARVIGLTNIQLPPETPRRAMEG
jgi:hypothetical protein